MRNGQRGIHMYNFAVRKILKQTHREKIEKEKCLSTCPGDLWAPWQHDDDDDDDGPPASRKQPEENNARHVDQAEGGSQQAAIARCSRRHSPRHLPFHSAAAGVEHEPRVRARAP